VHRLDLVLADEPLPRQAAVKAFNHALGHTGMSFLCARTLRPTLQGRFPQCLNGAPLLVPGAASAIRRRLDAWLAQRQLQPRIVGEFDDPALMKAFGRDGRGLFLAPTVLETEVVAQYGAIALGRAEDLQEEFFAISPERRISHPCVAAIAGAARGGLLQT
jgi:LysR family transcriptional regulator, transcriptional activator of nhaA